MRISVLLIIFVLVLFAVALACLFFASTVQSLAVRAVQMGPRSQALVTFVASKQYLFAVRAVGVLALIAALFLSVASIKSS
jgi:hypothetical protein